LSTGTIIGIVVGCLTGLGVLITIIVVIIILNKKKRARVWAVQAQQQQMAQPSFISGPVQQWPPGFQQQPYAGPTYNAYSPTYPSAQPTILKI
jgi:hypothetical protein